MVFGTSLYATGRAATTLPSSWVVLSARLIGTVALAIPLALAGRLHVVARRALPLVVAAGICEVLGFYSYTAGARHGIAVAAVLSSQFATIAAVVAYFLFKRSPQPHPAGGRLERDRRRRPAQRVARVNSSACASRSATAIAPCSAA